MVKLQGPSLSLDAAGSIGKALTFSNWKGRKYAKKLTLPTNPQSASQVGNRACARFLSTVWSEIPTSLYTQWQEIADQRNITLYNAFLAYNLEMWQRFMCPTRTYPGHVTPQEGLLNMSTATPLNRSIQIYLRVSTLRANWGYRLHRFNASGLPTSIANCVRMALWDSSIGTEIWWNDGPLAPGTYYYSAETFDRRGNSRDLWVTEFNATIT